MMKDVIVIKKDVKKQCKSDANLVRPDSPLSLSITDVVLDIQSLIGLCVSLKILVDPAITCRQKSEREQIEITLLGQFQRTWI